MRWRRVEREVGGEVRWAVRGSWEVSEVGGWTDVEGCEV